MKIILFGVWISLLAMAVGRRLLICVKAPSENGLEIGAFGFCLGFGILGYLVFIFGVAGLLSANVFYICFAVLTVLLGSDILRILQNAAEGWIRRLLVQQPLLGSILMGTLLLALFQSLVPSTAQDALAYHLDIPKRFIAAGRISYIPYGVNSVFPLLIQMFYLLGLLWNGSMLANVFHLMTAIGIVLGMFALGRKDLKPSFLILASIIFLLTPGIFNQMTIAYNDVALGFFIFFSYGAVLKWVETRHWSWMVLTGVFLGFALSVKYLGALAVLSISIYLFSFVLQKKISWKDCLGVLLMMGIVAFICSFVWYLRSHQYEHTFLYFGEKGYVPRESMKRIPFWLIPWFATVRPGIFGGSWAQAGPVYLAFLPGLFFLRNPSSRIKGLIGLSFAYFAFWIFLPRPNTRFLFPILPVWALLIAYLLQEFYTAKGLQKFLGGALGVVLVLQGAMAVYHGKNGYATALGLRTEADYLRRFERTYEVAEFLNGHVPRNTKILNAYEVRMFYFDRELVRETEFRMKSRYDMLAHSPQEVMGFLKHQGFTHVLIAEAPDPVEYPTLNIRYLVKDPAFVRQNLREIYRQPSRSDPRFQYALYEIRT